MESMMADKNSIFPEISRRSFIVSSGVIALLGACTNNGDSNNLDAGVDGDDDGGNNNSTSFRPPTTVSQRVRGLLGETVQPEEDRANFGLTVISEGEPYLERDNIDGSTASDGSTIALSSIAYFAQISDVHITDEESPARAIHSPMASAAAWRPQEPWSLQILDCTISTLNEFVEYKAPDFLFFTGDVTDNHLGIETSSFLDVIEGNEVDPDTGEDDNPREGDLPDPHDPFQAAGLNSQIPWYMAIGNHDKWQLGSVESTDLASPTSSTATTFYNLSHNVAPTCYDQPVCLGTTCYSPTPDRCYVPNSDDDYTSLSVPPDASRAYLNSNQFMMAINDSTAQGPEGHGFTQENIDNDLSYWIDKNVISGIPLALITLDTTSSRIGQDRSIGDIDAAQLTWLEEKLVECEEEDLIVVVVSHHPANEVENASLEIVDILLSYPNVVVHMVGHGHRNTIYPHNAPSGSEPWFGYWEIQSPSLIDWPQQFRLHEIVDMGDGTGAIYTTLVDLNIPEGDLNEGSRFYSLLDIQEGRSSAGRSGSSPDRNAILRFAWPPALLPLLSQLPSKDVESINFIPEK
jgi:3',5'-cyclic AMP phosphodiesterase CpdA